MGWWDRLTSLAWWPEAVEYEYKRLGLPKPYPQPSLLIEVPHDEMRSIVTNAGVRPETVWWTDGVYWTAPKADFEGWLAYNQIDKQRYQNDKYDCDNFAQSLVVAAINWVRGLAIGEVWYTKENGNAHAINIYVDSKRDVYTYEPQTDELRPIDLTRVHFMRL